MPVTDQEQIFKTHSVVRDHAHTGRITTVLKVEVIKLNSYFQRSTDI